MQERFINTDESLQMIDIEEFELPKPNNYEEMINNADMLFAELLIRYYFLETRKNLTDN